MLLKLFSTFGQFQSSKMVVFDTSVQFYSCSLLRGFSNVLMPSHHNLKCFPCFLSSEILKVSHSLSFAFWCQKYQKTLDLISWLDHIPGCSWSGNSFPWTELPSDYPHPHHGTWKLSSNIVKFSVHRVSFHMPNLLHDNEIICISN